MNAASIARLDPKSKKAGNGRFLISCPNPAHLDRNPSCIVYDGKKGVGFSCLAGCDWRDVRAGAELLGYIEPWRPNIDREFIAPCAELTKPKRSTLGFAQWLLSRSKPPAPDGPVYRYLINRAFELDFPEVIREVRTRHSSDGRNYAAMVCPVTTSTGKTVGCHVTYVNDDGTKADVFPNRKMFGDLAGAAVPLGNPLDQLALCEGIESGLSFQQMTGIPTWACLSTAGLVGFNFGYLKQVSKIVIAGDNDSAGKKAAATLAEKLTLGSKRVKIIMPPDIGDDWNDVLMRGVKAYA